MMNALPFLSGFTFLHPWVLAALAGLPALWWLLRLMPPAPKHILFAPVRFLAGLIPERQTPSHTPWWILLLRCLIIALIVIALAGPVRGPVETMDTNARIRIVIDNGWSSASLWDVQIRRAEDIIARAAQSKQEIEIAATALLPGREAPVLQGPMSAGEARTFLRTLEPLPWPSDNRKLLDKITAAAYDGKVHSYWLGTGIDESNSKALADVLQEQGKLFYFKPGERDLPLALKPDMTPEQPLRFLVDAPGATAAAQGRSVEAVSTDGRVLDRQPLTFTEGGNDGRVTFDLPADLRAHLSKVRIAGRQDAGALYMTDDISRRRSVGILTSKDVGDTKPFLDALFYLTRALSPYADLTTGDAQDLIERGQDVLIVTDDAAMPPAVLQELEHWLEQGGLILRFAGPDMKDMESLTPVPLRGGQRALEGNLSWERPQKLAAFPKDSPLSDIGLREDITVKSQVLADPSFDLTGKVWAALEDGTPLITADARGKGMLVMVHTAADPSWSDLPLSGVYVQMLRRIIMLSGTTAQNLTQTGDLQPVSVMNAYGVLRAATNEKPIPAADFATVVPNNAQPPGFYGRGGYTQALNLGERIQTLRPMPSLPAGAVLKNYDGAVQQNFTPWLLAASLMLFLLDWIVLMVMSGSLRALKWKHAAIILLLAFPLPAHADEKSDIVHAGDIFMAYVKSGQPSIDDTTERGLSALKQILEQRTSIAPGGVVAVNPENDDLSFYPFVYWPVHETASSLSDKAILNIQHYLDHGGTILFDTRGRTTNALQSLIRPLAVPALMPIEKDHVLNKTFYLIDSYPGRYNERQLWVEENSVAGRDGVSSIIIGSNDWAAAWAALPGAGGPSYLTGQTRQEELAIRFGVNFVMYALTGNYKADQVHLPHILQRLDQ